MKESEEEKTGIKEILIAVIAVVVVVVVVDCCYEAKRDWLIVEPTKSGMQSK